jgi:voltage-gated potassium channel
MSNAPDPVNSSAATQAGHITLFQIVVLILSVLLLGALLLDSTAVLPKETGRLVDFLDTTVCALFFIDFCIRFRRAESKLHFMKWGWIDLLASIPMIDALRWGRMVRILRIVRLLRAIRSFQRIVSIIFHNKVKSGLGAVFFISFLLIFFSSLAILSCEKGPDGNIKTAEDAIWWSVTTVTTVGYGDKYPLTLEGRIVAMILMVCGVGLFGTLSGLVASHFLDTHKRTREDEDIAAQLKTLNQKLDDLNQRLKGSEGLAPRPDRVSGI